MVERKNSEEKDLQENITDPLILQSNYNFSTFRIKIENLRKFLNRRKMQRIGKALVAISAFKEAARWQKFWKINRF